MALETTFAHGNVVVPQNAGGGNISSPGPLANVNGVAWTDVLGLPFGWGKAFRGKSGNQVWFHGTIPTPVHLESARTLVQDAFFLTSSEAGAAVTEVHIWDGPDRLAVFSGLHTAGDHAHTLQPGVNAFQPRIGGALHAMSFGLSISMLVNFSAEANITFHGLGANFVHGA